jgi:Sulfotransferase domain
MTTKNTKTPRVFINSLPKSGTHLLMKAVELFAYQDYAENPHVLTKNMPIILSHSQLKKELAKFSLPTVAEAEAICVGALSPLFVAPELFKEWLTDMPEHHYIFRHIPYSPALSPVLAELNYRHLFIIRDPRAVLPSLLAFILNPQGLMEKHFLAADFSEMSPPQRLDFILEGGYAPKANVMVRDFAQVYRSMLKWCDDPNCLAVRFEDLIGEQGGGSQDKQRNVVKKIAEYLQQPFNDTIVSGLEKIYNPSALTFRIGNVGSWKSTLSPDIIERLTSYCEPLWQEAGYEN